MSSTVSEQAGVQLSNATMTGGAVSGVVAWLMSIDWLGLLGATLAVLGFAVNLYFQARRDRRESRESEARLRALEAQHDGQG
jgi:hypothetical protein